MGDKQVVVTTALIIATTAAMQAQRRVAGQPAETTVPVTVALKAGADSYNFTGKATCSHAPVAAIYNLRAERWTVEQSDGPRSLTLALWHPASGSDLVSLSL